MLTIGDFHEQVLSGHYASPADHLPARPQRQGVRSWWRFYAGLARTVAKGLRTVRSGTFSLKLFSELAYDMVRVVEKTGANVTFEGFDALVPCRGKPFVIVANHMSLIETMLLPAGVFAANDMTVVAKRSLTRYPGFGKVLASCHPILLDRKNARKDLADTLEQGTALLKGGTSILLFPQGHRAAVFDPRRFNSLGAKLAARAGAPLVPVACKTDFARPGWPLRDFGPVDPQRAVKFACGPVLDPALPQRDLQEACIAHISAKLAEWGMDVATEHQEEKSNVEGN
jgi:1-acyl-sn-glycerol-3-phosphate acyltransferase